MTDASVIVPVAGVGAPSLHLRRRLRRMYAPGEATPLRVLEDDAAISCVEALLEQASRRGIREPRALASFIISALLAHAPTSAEHARKRGLIECLDKHLRAVVARPGNFNTLDLAAFVVASLRKTA